MDRRLQRRYWHVVKEHAQAATGLAAGIAALPGVGTAFAQTMALWRFLNNDRVTLPALVEPLRAAARDALADSPSAYALVVHDWCKLSYGGHASKRDLVQVTHESCFGYELTASLLVDAACGRPLGLMELQLHAADGVHSTRTTAVEPVPPHLEQILPTMQAAAGWNLPRRPVHVIDREADSLAHLREWTAAPQPHLVLIRVDHQRTVKWRDAPSSLPQIVRKLRDEGAFQFAREVEYQGRTHRQFVAETAIVLDKPGRKRRGPGQPRQIIPGPPLVLRLVVAQVRNEADTVLAEWLLVSNVPTDVPAAWIALWYYWRWRIESFFKLLKSAGQQAEQWLQETAPAVARRLLVAGMACLTVWHLQTDPTPPAQELQRVLVRLSGRQTKRRKPVTAPALLAGLQILLAMLDLLEEYSLDDLRKLARQALPTFFNSD
jgi:hypothetical protein